MLLTFLFLIPVFLIGIVCSYTDLKYGKIKNKWLIIGFAWALVLYLSLLSYNYLFLHQAGNLNYLKGMISNGLLALGLGYVLWNLKLWAAGDAKLFTLFAFLLPPEFYAKTYFSEFPSFVLLINIFVPLLVFLLVKALIFISRNFSELVRGGRMKKVLSDDGFRSLGKQIMKNTRVYIIFIFVFITLQVLMKEILSATNGLTSKLPQFYLFLIIFFLFKLFNNFISKHKSISLILSASGVLSCAYLIFSGQSQFLLSSLKIIVVFLVLVGLFQKILNIYIEQREVRKIKSEDVKRGMSLSPYGLDKEVKEALGKLDRGGLSEIQSDILRKIPGVEVGVYRTFALAPFIFLGTLLTILTKDSCLNLLTEFLRFLS